MVRCIDSCFIGTGEYMMKMDSHNSPRVRETLDSLRNKPIKSTTFQRICLSAEADNQVKGMQQPLQLGFGLKYIMERVSVPVKPHDLIVGRMEEKELNNKETEIFKFLMKRFPSVREQREFSPNVSHGQIELGGCRPLWMRDYGHTVFDWKRLLDLGLNGLRTIAIEKAEENKLQGETEKADFCKGAAMVYEAFQIYAERYGVACRAAGIEKTAEACENISRKPPATFQEAMQLIWLVSVVFCGITTVNPSFCLGRMDFYLFPFYKLDIQNETITREMAGELVQDLYCKLNLMAGRGDHLLSNSNFLDDSETDTGWTRNLNYDSPEYIILGGRNSEGISIANELTHIMVEKIVPRFENSVIVFRYTGEESDILWEKVLDKMRNNASVILYNDQRVISALMAGGASYEMAANHIFFGCNWCTFEKNVVYNWTKQFKPLHILGRLISESQDYELTCMENIYDKMRITLYEDIKHDIDSILKRRNKKGGHWENLLLVEDCFMDGPVEKGLCNRYGVTEYESLILSTVYIGSAIDSLYALKQLLFPKDGDKVPLGVVKSALKSNFQGYNFLQKKMLGFGKYGQDIEEVDKIGNILVNIAFDTAMQVIKDLGMEDKILLVNSLQTDVDYCLASQIGATPDGRLAEEPASQNGSPVDGLAKNGVTAMLNSIARVSHQKVASGGYNLKFQSSLLKGDSGLMVLKNLLKVYFRNGGVQAQLSVTDNKELRDAQKHPEQYQDLMVRITGYSACFVDMTAEAQEAIIHRDLF